MDYETASKFLLKAAPLSGKAIQVALFLLEESRGRTTFKPSKRRLKEFGLSNASYSKGVSRLEENGMLSVERKPGQNIKVKLWL